MKICSKCKQEKKFDAFINRKKNKDGLSSYCKECYYEYNKKSYYKDPKKRNNYLILKRREKVHNFNKWIIESNLKCKKCGEDHPAVLDFHHINPEEKKGNISNLKWRGLSKETLFKEIEKCIILCANCHRKLHWEEKLKGDGI